MKQKIFIPTNFADALPELKNRALRWRTEYNSGTDANTCSIIESFSLNGDNAINAPNLILVPGLASNAHSEPLMRAITYWGLTYKYNVYMMTTFLNDFKPLVPQSDIWRHNLSEYITSLRVGINIISRHVGCQWTCLIGHSAGGNGILELIQTDRVPPQISSAIAFAPYVSNDWHNYCKNMWHIRQHPDKNDQEFLYAPISLINPQETLRLKKTVDTPKMHCVSIMPYFMDELNQMRMNPELISQRGIPITLVGGGRDRKSPISNLRNLHQQLTKMPNGKLFKFVEFKNSKHSFIDQYRDASAIIELIKSQRQKRFGQR